MKTNILIFVYFALTALNCSSSKALENPPNSTPENAPSVVSIATPQPIELGIIEWSRDLDAAKIKSTESGRPLLILFNEVPGCNTVKGFGKTVLSDPSIRQIIETQFVPVYIQNNSGGKDADILKQYGEPAWNNPIVRIYDRRGKEIAKRFAGPYSLSSFAKHLNQTLEANPNKKRQNTGNEKTATFAMYCFWTGEAKFGNIDGVVRTRPGFQNGHEVVEVTFDSSVISYESLSKIAVEKEIANVAIVDSQAQFLIAKKAFKSVERKQSDMRFSKKDDKYFLNRSSYKKLKLTPFQSTKINAVLKLGGDPDAVLNKK